MNEELSIEEKYLMAERGRVYLELKCNDLEAKINLLEQRAHEMAHRIEGLARESEYWQGVASRG